MLTHPDQQSGWTANEIRGFSMVSRWVSAVSAQIGRPALSLPSMTSAKYWSKPTRAFEIEEKVLGKKRDITNATSTRLVTKMTILLPRIPPVPNTAPATAKIAAARRINGIAAGLLRHGKIAAMSAANIPKSKMLPV